MAMGQFAGSEARNTPRFVPPESLSVFLANNMVPLVRGAVKDLSEVGARVLTNEALDSGKTVTVDVRSGYSFLFRAEARIVWRSIEYRRDSAVCLHGILFTDLSTFSRKLIRRLGGIVPGEASPPPTLEPVEPAEPVESSRWEAYAESDPDLGVLFPTSMNGLRRVTVDDRFDVLSDPVLEAPLFGVPPEEALETRTGGEVELSGNLGYFNNADVLQMLEAARATGVLFIEGEHEGEIHLKDGRICGCFSTTLSDQDAAFVLIITDRGRFRFVPTGVRSNLLTSRTTTQLLLEAQVRLDHLR